MMQDALRQLGSDRICGDALVGFESWARCLAGYVAVCCIEVDLKITIQSDHDEILTKSLLVRSVT